MKKYKYQMHMHSLPCSLCSRIDIETLVRTLYDGGYAGGVITNHFLHGNTALDRKLPWKDFVAHYENDYLKGKKIADELGIDLLFCIEEGVGGGLEIMPYGITPEILYRHPELRNADISLWHKTMQSEGCLVIQAHPFREREYIPSAGLLADTDGFEVFNYCNNIKNNIEASEAAKNLNCILTSGGDAHSENVLCHGGIETAKRITSEKDLADVLKKGMYNLISE